MLAEARAAGAEVFEYEKIEFQDLGHGDVGEYDDGLAIEVTAGTAALDGKLADAGFRLVEAGRSNTRPWRSPARRSFWLWETGSPQWH